MTRLSQWVNTCRPCSSRGTREGRTCRNEIDFVQELKQGPKFKNLTKDVLRNKKQKRGSGKKMWRKVHLCNITFVRCLWNVLHGALRHFSHALKSVRLFLFQVSDNFPCELNHLLWVVCWRSRVPLRAYFMRTAPGCCSACLGTISRSWCVTVQLGLTNSVRVKN